MGCTRRVRERFNQFWPSVSNAASQLTAIAQAIVDSRPIANLRQGFNHVLRLPEYFQNRIKSKETTAIIKQAAVNTLNYAAVPFLYHSAIQPKLKSSFGEDSSVVTASDYMAYGLFWYFFIRRLVDYTIDAVRIPYAVNEGLNQEHIAYFLDNVADQLTLLYGRAFSKASRSIKDTLYKELREAFYNTTFKQFNSVETRQALTKNLERAFLHTFFDDSGSNIPPSQLPKKIAKPLADIILDTLQIVFVKKPKNINLLDYLNKKHNKKILEVFKTIYSQDSAEQYALQTMDSVVRACKEMQSKIKPSSYQPCECDTQKKLNLAIRGPFYYIGNAISAELIAKLINFISPNTTGFVLALAVRALLYGQSLLEYKLAASGICVEDRYKKFANTNFFCMGVGASHLLLAKALTFPLSFFYGVNSFFIDDAAANLILQLNLVSLLIDREGVPEDPVKLDVSYYSRKTVDKILETSIDKIKPKLIKLNDQEARERCIQNIKRFLNFRPLTWTVALVLGDPANIPKFFLGKVQDRDLNLLDILFSIPSVKLLAQTFEPNLTGAMSALEWVRYFSFVLTSPLLQRNPIFFLFMPNIVMSLLSLPIHILNDQGFQEIIRQIYGHIHMARGQASLIDSQVDVRFIKEENIEDAIDSELSIPDSTALVQRKEISESKPVLSDAKEVVSIQPDKVKTFQDLLNQESKEQQVAVILAPITDGKLGLLESVQDDFFETTKLPQTSSKVTYVPSNPKGKFRVSFFKTGSGATTTLKESAPPKENISELKMP